MRQEAPDRAGRGGGRPGRRAVLLAGVLGLAGCSYVPPPLIVPAAETAGPPHFGDATLQIAPVARYPISAGELVGALTGQPQVSAEMFRHALARSLHHARLFRAVSTETGAGYVLQADVLRAREGGYGAEVEVRYRLVARGGAAPRELWHGRIVTAYRYPLTVGTFLMPANANTRALWHAFRDNQQVLIARLAALPTP